MLLCSFIVPINRHELSLTLLCSHRVVIGCSHCPSFLSQGIHTMASPSSLLIFDGIFQSGLQSLGVGCGQNPMHWRAWDCNCSWRLQRRTLSLGILKGWFPHSLKGLQVGLDQGGSHLWFWSKWCPLPTTLSTLSGIGTSLMLNESDLEPLWTFLNLCPMLP